MYCTQTKYRNRRPLCEDGVGALGLGATNTYAMLGAAKAAAHHGWPIFGANYVSREVYLPYVGSLHRNNTNISKKITKIFYAFNQITETNALNIMKNVTRQK